MSHTGQDRVFNFTGQDTHLFLPDTTLGRGAGRHLRCTQTQQHQHVVTCLLEPSNTLGCCRTLGTSFQGMAACWTASTHTCSLGLWSLATACPSCPTVVWHDLGLCA